MCNDLEGSQDLSKGHGDPLTDEGINKVWSVHTVEYYSALKRKEILTPAATCMKLEAVMLSERRQSPKDSSCDCTH